jgi:hypothetical protein
MTAVLAAIDAGSAAGVLTIYNSVRPATGGAVTTALAVLPLGAISGVKPSGSVSGGVLSLLTNGATGVAAINTGTPTWGRVTDSSGNFYLDLSVGASGCDINLSSASIITGQTVSVTSGGTITEGNA